METVGPRLSLSPPPSYSSSDNLADIAARVVREFEAESDPSDFDEDDDGSSDWEFTYEGESNYPSNEVEKRGDEEMNRNEGDVDDDDDFEFVVAASSPICADEIFSNGQIRPIYPVFNRNLYFDGFGFVHTGSNSEKSPLIPIPIPIPRVRMPLGKLMREDRDPPSCSSSEADELEGVPSDIYCIWKPKKESDEKSKSVESASKRWRFCNLLYHRSNSEEKDMMVFATAAPPPPKQSEKEDGEAGCGKTAVAAVTAAAAGLRRKGRKDGEKKAGPYLPYRKDIVGLFSNLHLHPF